MGKNKNLEVGLPTGKSKIPRGYLNKEMILAKAKEKFPKGSHTAKAARDYVCNDSKLPCVERGGDTLWTEQNVERGFEEVERRYKENILDFKEEVRKIIELCRKECEKRLVEGEEVDAYLNNWKYEDVTKGVKLKDVVDMVGEKMSQGAIYVLFSSKPTELKLILKKVKNFCDDVIKKIGDASVLYRKIREDFEKAEKLAESTGPDYAISHLKRSSSLQELMKSR
jgi:Zn-dependent M32 family carboxypeptidase